MSTATTKKNSTATSVATTPSTVIRSTAVLTKNAAVEVFPTEVNFKNVEANVIYETNISISNISPIMTTIRITPPNLSSFRILNFVPKKQIAPGLEFVLQIQFSAKEEKKCLDKIVVNTDVGNLEIPLRASFPAAELEFPSQFDFGTIVAQSSITQYFTIQNRGNRQGKFEFIFLDPAQTNIIIAPQLGTVGPMSNQSVKIQWKGLETAAPGVQRIPIKVKNDNQGEETISLVVKVVEGRVELLDPDGIVTTQILFESLYFGQKKTAKCILFNNSPFPLDFQVLREEEEKDVDEEELEDELPPPAMSIFPQEGKLEPFQQMSVDVLFQPMPKLKTKGFLSTLKHPSDDIESYTEELIFKANNSEQKLSIRAFGKAMQPFIEISDKKFVFGECKVNEYLDILCTVKNAMELPIDFTIPRIAHFHASPSSGTLAPLETKNIIFTFQPNQLGHFHSVMHLILGNNLKKITLYMSGSADAMSESKKFTSGVDKTLEDFERPTHFVKVKIDEDVDKSVAIKSTARMTRDKEDIFFESEASIIAYNEYRKKKENEKKYNDFILKSREDKELALKLLQLDQLKSFVNDTDLGMEPSAGLHSPHPVFKMKEEKLYLQDSNGMGITTSTSMMKKPKKFDEDKLWKKKFKGTPSTATETKDCSTELSTKQLRKITAGPKVLQFGKVGVFSEKVKNFTIRNDLKQYIRVEVGGETNEIKISPKSQVIPPLCTTGFDVCVRGEMNQTIQQNLFFLVNGKGKIKFSLQAEIIPLDVVLSAEEVHFRFNEYTLEQFVTETISITNKGAAKAIFKWVKKPQENSTAPAEKEEEMEHFAVSPMSGEIDPGKSSIVELTCTPGSEFKFSQEYLLHIEGCDVPKTLSLVADLKEAKLALQEKKLDFGIIPVGIRCQKTLNLKNLSETASVFHIQNLSSEFRIRPLKARVARGSSQQITIELKPSSPQIYDTTLEFMVRSGKNISIPLKAESKLPVVEISGEDILDFGSLFIGNMGKIEISLSNVGSNIPAVLFCDLRDFVDFYLATLNGELITETSETDDSICVASSASGSQNGDNSDKEDEEETAGAPTDVDKNFEKEGDELNEAENEDEDDVEGYKYQITIKPNTTLNFFLVFKPKMVGNYNFPLPLHLAGAVSSFNRTVVAESIKPRLIASKTNIDFGPKVVIKEGNCLPHKKIFALTNEDKKDIVWELGVPEATKPFKFEPTEGVLAPGDVAQIQITFTPEEMMDYEASLPVYLDSRRERSYLTIKVKGKGSNPNISFDKHKIVLPIVPLGIKASETLLISNEGFDKLELKYKLPVDTDKMPVTLNFPDGTLLGGDNTQIRAEICFLSSKPVSFTATIEFYDGNGKSYPISVTCTADNNLFTLFPYITTNREKIKVETEAGKPIKVVEREAGRLSENPDEKDETFSSYSGYTGTTTSTATLLSQDEKIKRKIFNKRVADRLVSWLNINVLKDPIDDLLKNIYFSNGGIVYEIIQTLSGKPPPPRVSNLPTNKLEAAKALLNQYKELIRFLKTLGCLLHDLNPLFLLKYEDYQRVILSEKDTTNSDEEDENDATKRKMSEKRFKNFAHEAWLVILFQLLKLFFIYKVNVKGFHKMPGVEEHVTTEKDTTLTNSNLYSVSECIVLKWLSYHYNKIIQKDATAPALRVTSFGSELSNSKVFAAVFLSHIPSLSSKFDTFHFGEVSDRNDMEHNASVIINVLKEARLDYDIGISDIVRANPREMLMFCTFLFQNMPSYIPKSIIEFEGNLLEKITKTIELSNPSKKTIEYGVTIDSLQFTAESDNIVLKPSSKYPLQVSISPKFLKSVESRITLYGIRSGTSKPATLVFTLKTNVHKKNFLKVIETKSVIFEMKKVDIVVENPYEKNGLFAIQLEQSCTSKIKSNNNNASNPLFSDAFFSPIELVNIKKGEKKTISIQFLPFAVDTDYDCVMVFSDNKVGEFLYKIKGKSEKPAPMDSLTIISEINKPIERTIALQGANNTAEKAISILKDRAKKQKSTLSNATAILQLNEPEEVTFKVKSSNPFFKVANEFKLNKKASGKAQLPFQFVPTTPGIYESTIIMTSDYDYRVYQIIGKAKFETIKAEINFSTPVRHKIVQEIPITNKSDIPWKISVHLTGDGYSGSGELKVPPQKTVPYILTFSAVKMGTFLGELTLSNADTLETYQFALQAIAHEPHFEDTISLECKAKSTIEHILHLKPPENGTHKQGVKTYQVKYELPQIMRGNTTIDLESGKTTNYVMNISSPVGGLYEGTVSFVDADGEMMWYLFKVNVTRSAAEKIIPITCVIREQCQTMIPIHNPLDKSVTYQIKIEGSEYLSGDLEVELQPNETKEYKLVYKPYIVGQSKGSISFFHELTGEFWYELQIQAQDTVPTELSEMKCEIGKKADTKFTMQNPSEKTVTFVCESNNARNFQVNPSSITIGPLQTLTFQVQYTPSSINREESSVIKVKSSSDPTLGEWNYLVKGRGLEPSSAMEKITILAQLRKSQSSVISFRNPFPETKKLQIHFMQSSSAFQILSKRLQHTVSVQPFSVIQIPFSFTPLAIDQYKGTIVIQVVGEVLKWEYLVEGFVEVITGETFMLNTKARTSLEKVIEINLTDLPVHNNTNEGKFTHRLDFPAKHTYLKAVRRSLAVELIEELPLVTELNGSVSKKLVYKLEFSPLRPFAAQVDLVIERSSGGLWRYELQLEAERSAIDDAIAFECTIGKVDRVSFRLSNIFAHQAQFEAYFTSETPLEFSITPESGQLAAYGYEGTKFVLSYSTNDYGKVNASGMLVIETEEMQWLYEVHVTFAKKKLDLSKITPRYFSKK